VYRFLCVPRPVPLAALAQSYYDSKYFLTCPAVPTGGSTNYTTSGICTGASDLDACTMTCTGTTNLVAGAGMELWVHGPWVQVGELWLCGVLVCGVLVCGVRCSVCCSCGPIRAHIPRS
jgi:hypothetical protein